MAILPWVAGADVLMLCDKVKNKHHITRLSEASIAWCFADSKPFVKERFNWGKVSRFQNLHRLWHANNNKYDFLVVLSATAWSGVLNDLQREALVDLHLSRCSVHYVPVMVEEEPKKKGGKGRKPKEGKKRVVKDEWDRIEYTDEIARDDEGNPKWKVLPLDLHVFGENAQRYGVWCEELLTFKQALSEDSVEDLVSVEADAPPHKEPWQIIEEIGDNA